MNQPRRITLTEYRPATVPRSELPQALAETLRQQHANQLHVELVWAEPGTPWRLTSQGWAGCIPLSPDLQLWLRPKAPLANLFRMLEYAYRLDFKMLPNLIQADSLPEFFERLAHILARRVLDRVRQGVYRTYVPQADRLPYLRGRLNVAQSARTPWQVGLACTFEEHTADVPDNQILLYTLWLLAYAVQNTQLRPTVRQAYRALHGPVSLRPVSAADCVGRSYHRLNDDYRALHALCRFFLEQLGPGHRPGERHMLPFLVDMARLFELFTTEWLAVHLPPFLQLKAQERVDIGRSGEIHFQIDLVLYQAATGQPRCVLDTKYKYDGKPSNQDIFQIVAYAKAKQCREAVLVYPAPLAQPLDTWWDDIRVRSVTFDLGEALDAAGRHFLQQLLSPIPD